MSSSETEEFFDALDVSPGKELREDGITQQVSTGAEGDESINISGEERRLLETKKLVDIRRKLEDEALNKQLKQIQEQRDEARRLEKHQQDIGQSADQNDRRRRKLLELRAMMSNEGNTPDEPQNRHSSLGRFETDSSGGGSVGDLAGQDPGEKEIRDNLRNIEIEKQDAPQSVDATTIQQEGQKQRQLKGGRGISSQTKSESRSSSHSEVGRECSKPAESEETSQVTLRHSMQQVHSDSQRETESDMQKGTESDILEGQLSAHEPDLIQSVKSSSLGRNISAPAIKTQPASPTEPGLGALSGTASSDDVIGGVQLRRHSSGKTDMLPPPVVPPRRKKKVVSTSDLDQIQVPGIAKQPSATTTTGKHRPQTVPPNTLQLPGDRTGCLLTAPSPQIGRKSLNLNDATMGDRVVTAAEEEGTRAVNDVNLAVESELFCDTDSIAESCMSSPSVSNESTKSDKENRSSVVGDRKSHSFPRSQSRQDPGDLSVVEKALLDQVSVLNLDTGERIPIGVAEGKVPKGINPLSLHIMRRTKEYLSDTSLNANNEDGKKESTEEHQVINTVKGLGKKRKKLKSLFGKAKNKLKSVKDEVFHKEESSSSSEEEDGERRMIKVKASKAHKGPYDFDLLVPVQYIEGAHTAAVWTMKFSQCGRLLASGGQDNLLRVWVLKDAYSYFDDMRLKYSEEQKKKLSPAASEDSLESDRISEASSISQEEEQFSPFKRKPFCTYKGHSADILDVSWSKNYFILTSSMDKTVRLWHVSRKECLCCFQHIDFVTAIAFHPKDDRYFLSGSLDGKLRLWNIPDKKVTLWNEVSGSTKLITAANFCMNGKFAVVGTYDGRCVFYSTEQLKYYTQIHVRSTRGKNSKGRKVTGVEPYPGEDKILVTSNDSRIRMYDLRDLTLTCKYKGCANNSSQIKACFSHDGRFLVCGSEDHFVYIWRTQHEFHKFSSARRDRSDYWESIKAHNAVVTVALFAPKPNLIIKNQFEFLDSDDKMSTPAVRGEVLVSADYNGTIKCFINKFKPGSG